VPQVVDDRGDDGERDAVLDPQNHHRGRRDQGHRELVFPEGQDPVQAIISRPIGQRLTLTMRFTQAR